MKNTILGFIERMFGALSESARKDIKSFMIVITCMACAFFISKWTDCESDCDDDKDVLVEKILSDRDELNKIIRQELRNQIYPEMRRTIQNEVKEKTEPTKKALENASQSLRELTEAVKNAK